MIINLGIGRDPLPADTVDDQVTINLDGYLLGVDDPSSAAVAQMYLTFGDKLLSQLDGAYALIVNDKHNGTIRYGTDPLGLCPLYTAVFDNQLIIASTINDFDPSLWRHVFRVIPGMLWDEKNHATPTAPRVVNMNWRDALTAAVAACGNDHRNVLLSGGVDSTVITALASRLGTVSTFTVGFPGSLDFEWAQQAAERFNTNHHQVLLDVDDIEHLAIEVVAATASFEPWLILGGIGTLAALQVAAKTGVTSVLTGEGADELFAGYCDFDRIPTTDLNQLLRAYQYDLGATEALRLDRCARAARIQARIPFLAGDVVAAINQLPVSEKRDRPGDPDSMTKVALREFAIDLGVGQELAWRPKDGISQSVGATKLLAEVADGQRDRWPDIVDRHRFAAPGLNPNEPTVAWLLGVWLEHWGDRLAVDWADLERRRLVRQSY